MDQQPIVELADIEHQKENIQPLRSGRSAAALAERFADSAAKCTATSSTYNVQQQLHMADLERQRQSLEDALASVSDTSDDDPLDPFHRYIRWVEQYYSQDHPSYMRVLENAIRRFRKDFRYKNDPRHLMLWMRLAKRTPNPVDIFKYLSVNEIGLQTALYYEEYATLMETCCKFKEAQEILTLGINRNAQPVDRLTRSRKEFLARRSTAAISEELDPTLDENQQSDLDSRKPLENIVSSASRSQSATQQHQVLSSRSAIGQRQGKIKVFVDADPNTDSVSLENRVMPTTSLSNPWPIYDGESQRRKENVPEPTKWVGATFPQKQPLKKPISADIKIPVYQDKLEQAFVEPEKRINPNGNQTVLHEVPPSSKHTTLLQSLDRDLSPVNKIAALPTVEPALPRPPVLPTNSVAINKSNAAKDFACAWKKDLFFADGLELSFEEYRAQIPRYRFVQKLTFPLSHTQKNTQIDNAPMDISMRLNNNTQPQSSRSRDAGLSTQPFTISTNHQQSSRPFVQHNISKAKEISSPTINTKAAMEDIFKMFSVPLTADDPKNAQISETGADWDDDEETISSKIYRPTSANFKIGVFHDEENEGSTLQQMNDQADLVPISQRVFGSNLSSSAQQLPPHPMQSLKTDHATSILLRENKGLKNASQHALSGLADELPLHGANTRPTSENSLLMHSTPYSSVRSGDVMQDKSINVERNMTTISRARMIFGQTLDPMTPITEASSELDRTIGGLSTVCSQATLSGISTILEEVDDTMAYKRRPLDTASDDLNITADTKQTHAIFDDDNMSREKKCYIGNKIIHSMNDTDIDYSNCVRNLHMSHQAVAEPCLPQNAMTGYSMQAQDNDQALIIDVPNPCDPNDKNIQQTILAISPSTSQKNTSPIYDHGDSDAILPVDKSRNKYTDIHLDSVGVLNVLGHLGNGAFAQVYLVQRDLDQLDAPLSDADLANLLDDSFSNDFNGYEEKKSYNTTLTPHIYALKIQSPPSSWEHYILCTLQHRVPDDMLDSIVWCYSMYMYRNCSMMLLPHCKYGSILDCLNTVSTNSYGVDGAGVNEALAVFWTIEMLKIVAGIHAVGVIHGDIKADNVMLRFESDSAKQRNISEASSLQAQYQAGGSGGWSSKGLMVVDWGRSIDLKMFDMEQLFITPVPTAKSNTGRGGSVSVDESIECLEVRTGCCWKFQPDWYGVASIAHLLLFRTDMQVVNDMDAQPFGQQTRLKLKRPLKRNWQTGLWTRLFDILLNSGMYGAGTADDCIAAIDPVRVEFEQWLEKSSVRGSTMLRGLLSSVQATAMEKRRHQAR
ncbi:hypothetical protein BDV3_004860 [Batrachochytrium dendrobatidis]